MLLYLSSYKIGNNEDFFKEWIEKNGNKIVLIPNSRDIYPESERKTNGINNDIALLEEIGFDVNVLSLKDYFGNYNKLKEDLKDYRAFWVIGGNTFALRKAFELSGFDTFLKEISNNKNYLYGGYSAGICVLAPNLKGLDLVDEPINPYNKDEVIYDGLGIINYVPIPHYKSDHPESELVEKVLEYCKENNINYKTMKDGDVEIIGSEKMNEVKIRNIEFNDLRSVSEIAIRGWQTAYRGIVDDEYLDNLSIEENYQKRLKDYKENGFIVAEYNNEVVGFCRYREGNNYIEEYPDIDCEICALYVKPEEKGKGIGKKIVKYVMSEFKSKKFKKMIIWCFKENDPSRAFYEKMGGTCCGESSCLRGNKEYLEVGYVYDLEELRSE